MIGHTTCLPNAKCVQMILGVILFGLIQPAGFQQESEIKQCRVEHFPLFRVLGSVLFGPTTVQVF